MIITKKYAFYALCFGSGKETRDNQIQYWGFSYFNRVFVFILYIIAIQLILGINVTIIITDSNIFIIIFENSSDDTGLMWW